MERKKKILIGISGHIISDQRMIRIGNALLDFGYDIEILYRNYYKYKSNDKENALKFDFQIKGYKLPINSGIGMYLLLNHRYFWSQLFKSADAYYAVDSDTLLAFTFLSKIKRKPLIYDAHEYFCEVPELKSKWKKKIWHIITQLGVNQSSVRYTVGPQLASELSKRYGKLFGTIKNVPSISQKTIEITTSKRPIIIYQGALNEGRKIELLIEAMQQLPMCDCLIIGEGDLSLILRQKAASLNNVIFKGLLTPDELRAITPTCFAGFNLLDASQSLSYYYSLSNKYFDYMHAGIPSISSRLPEYLDLNEKTRAGVCIDDTLIDLTNQIKRWLEFPNEYDKLKENANIASKTYNWEKEKEVLKTLIKI
ncbi:MAG: glycosyltransferase [Bacteroidia bacterium]|nr:glycosyltransferase [Bacteroidia bacterium]